MNINRDDVNARRVLPHLIENGVWVPPALRINCMTKREHMDKERLSAEELERLYPEPAAEA